MLLAFLAMVFVGTCVATALGVALGWGMWVQVARDGKAEYLRWRRRVRREAVRVPPVVGREAAAVRVMPVRYSATPLLTRSEKAFYQVLREAMGKEWQITLKPRLADLVKVRGGEALGQAYREVGMKQMDFALMDPETLEVVLLVELEDATKRAYRRRQRGALVDRVCAGAGLRVLRVPVRGGYEVGWVRGRCEEGMSKGQ